MSLPVAKNDNVVPFPPNVPGPSPRYTLDVISEFDVNGMILIEACIPRASLAAMLAILNSLAPN